ncbi:MAG: hypothetical protein PHX83_07050 [Acidobacteriia bacterium]|nr:hypothetical protein [Terriglobia bacterium]
MTDESQTWRSAFWKAVHNYVAACGGDHDLFADKDAALAKMSAVRDIEAALIQTPGIEAQLRLDLIAYRVKANAATVAALGLVEIAQHMASGEVTVEQQVKARETLSKVSETLAQLTVTSA